MYKIPKNDNIRFYSSAILSLFDEWYVNDTYLIPLFYDDGDRRYMNKKHTKVEPLYKDSLPAMSLKFNGIERDTEHVNNKYLKYRGVGYSIFAPTRYSMNYELTIKTKTNNELYSIIESINDIFEYGSYFKDVKLPFLGTEITTLHIQSNTQITSDMKEYELESDREPSAIVSLTVYNCLFVNEIELDGTQTISRINLNLFVGDSKEDLVDANLIQSYIPMVEG